MTKRRGLWKTILLLYFLVLFLTPNLRADEKVLSPYTEAILEFEIFVKERMARDRVPGLSIGFMKDDFIWANGYGFSDLENGVPAKADSAYRLASITKTITAIAVLNLVEEGKIDLDAEVHSYVPYFPQKKWPVTVRLLLGHLGGISHYKDYAVEGRIREPMDTKEALAIFQDWDLVAEPGTRYNYSSYGYNLLGAVVEGASGEPYGKYIQKNIFQPLGMTSSRMDNQTELIANRVRGYRLVGGEIKNSEYVNVSSRFAGGGTRSTVVDLLKYARGIIDGKLLKKETWDQMFLSMATKKGQSTGYGMGWSTRPWNGHFQVSHGGSQPETRTHLLIFPLDGFAVAVGCNLEGTNLVPYVTRLSELILDEDLDSRAYVLDDVGQAIYQACAQIFSRGISQFLWKGRNLSLDLNDLEETFVYLNSHVSVESLTEDFKKTDQKIEDGFNPAGKNALIFVGEHMASVLGGTGRENKLRQYIKKGPLAFFGDYIRISRHWPEEKRKMKLSDSLSQLLLGWEKDWDAVYTDDIRSLWISSQTDPKELEKRIKEPFLKASLYPDFSDSFTSWGEYLLRTEKIEKAFAFLHLGTELYPQNVSALVSLASAHVWTGNGEKAKELYTRAFAQQATHPALSLPALENFAHSLQSTNKIDEIFILAEIALELRPKHAGLHEMVGDWHLRTGKNEKALHLYRKALELNPKLKGIRDKIKNTEEKIKK
jgi:CubicO group peptidase (beta-lactamase class C family)/tetratricopeptide (TPR) repeat protein